MLSFFKNCTWCCLEGTITVAFCIVKAFVPYSVSLNLPKLSVQHSSCLCFLVSYTSKATKSNIIPVTFKDTDRENKKKKRKKHSKYFLKHEKHLFYNSTSDIHVLLTDANIICPC